MTSFKKMSSLAILLKYPPAQQSYALPISNSYPTLNGNQTGLPSASPVIVTNGRHSQIQTTQYTQITPCKAKK